jgi:hypothetical protein
MNSELSLGIQDNTSVYVEFQGLSQKFIEGMLQCTSMDNMLQHDINTNAAEPLRSIIMANGGNTAESIDAIRRSRDPFSIVRYARMCGERTAALRISGYPVREFIGDTRSILSMSCYLNSQISLRATNREGIRNIIAFLKSKDIDVDGVTIASTNASPEGFICSMECSHYDRHSLVEILEDLRELALIGGSCSLYPWQRDRD